MFNLFLCASRAKRVDMSDNEGKEDENLKKKRRRIKRPQSDSSEDEGKKMRLQETNQGNLGQGFLF